MTRYSRTYPARRQRVWRTFGVRTLFDIGANAGQYGLQVRQYGFTGDIHSFEPLAEAFSDLSQAADGDDHWFPYQLALGEESGDVLMNVSDASMFSSILPVTDATLKGFAPAVYVRKERVHVRTLDSIRSAEAIAPGPYAVKMDVQGFEKPVIEGGETTISQASAVEVELCPVELYEGQALMLELLNMMNERDFVPALVDSIFPQEDGRSLAFNCTFVPSSTEIDQVP